MASGQLHVPGRFSSGEIPPPPLSPVPFAQEAERDPQQVWNGKLRRIEKKNPLPGIEPWLPSQLTIAILVCLESQIRSLIIETPEY
jgi:hypothetical protein